MGDGHNTLSPDLLDDFDAVLVEIEERSDGPRALVTTATGKVWSNGLDVAWMAENESGIVDYLARVQHLLARILELGVPTIAAVTGHSFGSGAMLSLCHDVTVMRSDRGYWCLPEVDLGMWLTPGEHGLVQAKLPPATVNEALTTGRRYGATDACSAGIVQEVAAEESVLERAVQIAVERAGKAGDTLASIKRGIYGSVADQLRRDMSDLAGSDAADRRLAEFVAVLRRAR